MKDNHYKNEQTAKSGMPIFNIIGFNFTGTYLNFMYPKSPLIS